MIEQTSMLLSRFLVILLAVHVIACSQLPAVDDSLKIKRLIFLNKSDKPLSDVRIYISKTRELMTCGYLLPKSECSTGFPLRKYQGNRFDVSWVEEGQSRLIRNILIKIPDNYISGKSVNAVIVFDRNGHFLAKFQQ